MLRVYQSEPYVVAGCPVGPFGMNQYIVVCPKTLEAACIDCGAGPAPFVAFADEASAALTRILLTHGHVDHVAGLAETRRAIAAPIHLHAAERGSYDEAPIRGAFFGLRCEQPPPPDHELADGETVQVGEITFEVLHTPGHTPGHVCFVDRSAGVAFTGDLLFRGSIGRTDLPGADPSLMGPSLARMLELPDETVVYPGHMGPTTIGDERVSNPFLSLFIGS